MNAPIRYFGGKGTMFNNIIKLFPNENEYNSYVEPFSGSFSVGLKNPNPKPVEIYNDLEQNVYSLYKVLSSEKLFNEFKEKCDLVYYSEQLRFEFKQKLKHPNLNILDRAFYFFYVNRTSHNGIGGFSSNLIVRRNMAKSVSDMLSSIDRLYELHQRLSKTIILNSDALKIIKKYDNKNTFFYCDPPYEQSTRTSVRYSIDMDNEKQKEFLSLVLKCEGKFLISGYDNKYYDVLTDNGWDKINFNVKTIGGNMKPKTKIETLWKNY
jgi:DNA adenine methylase